MYFDSVSAAVTMDGHGGYVWTAYIITVVVLLLVLSVPRRRERRFLRQLAGEMKRQRTSATMAEEK